MKILIPKEKAGKARKNSNQRGGGKVVLLEARLRKWSSQAWGCTGAS